MTPSRIFRLSLLALFCGLMPVLSAFAQTGDAFVRVNLLGYLPEDTKVALAFSEKPQSGSFSLRDEESGEVRFKGNLVPSEAPGWGRFPHYYTLDFSSFREPGRYVIELDATGDRSPAFGIGRDAYGTVQDDLLVFMRQQRCGYNPFLDMVCHRHDGRSMFGTLPDSTYIDVSGGWHDAGDQLKYLITSSNATARMLLAYRLAPEKFGDRVDAYGRPFPNGVADVLDEARWGLEWLHKMHPAPDQLYHQVADDRDHIGWKWPNRDSSDYGWGPFSYRVAYFATGQPQGLREYKSKATGVANLAGRVAAAMALAYDVFKDDDPGYAEMCLQKARSAYALGKQKEGFQQGNSY